MAAGPLDRRIQIQQAAITRAASGQEIESWSTLATVWAELMQGSGGEDLEESTQRISARKVTWRIRYRSGITPKMRVIWDTHVYEVLDVAEHERRRWLHLMCEVVNARSGA